MEASMARDPARKSARKSARKPARQTAAPPPRSDSIRDKAVAALMALLAERSFEEIGLAEVAGRAGISLSQLRGEFGATLGILAAHMKDIDRAVLDGNADDKADDKSDDMAEESPRDRLFEVLMRRIDALAPYKDAIGSLMRSARRNPGLAVALNGLAVRSQRWMLTAADIGSSGPRGAMRAQGAALMFARVVAVWLDDDEEGLDRTMAALDRGLASAERWVGFIDDLCSIPACLARGPRRRRRRDEFDEDVEAA
jgi:AcrR family transcriptional regulator